MNVCFLVAKICEIWVTSIYLYIFETDRQTDRQTDKRSISDNYLEMKDVLYGFKKRKTVAAQRGLISI